MDLDLGCSEAPHGGEGSAPPAAAWLQAAPRTQDAVQRAGRRLAWRLTPGVLQQAVVSQIQAKAGLSLLQMPAARDTGWGHIPSTSEDGLHREQLLTGQTADACHSCIPVWSEGKHVMMQASGLQVTRYQGLSSQRHCQQGLLHPDLQTTFQLRSYAGEAICKSCSLRASACRHRQDAYTE